MSLPLLACNPALEPARLQPAPGPQRFATSVRTPAKLSSIETGRHSGAVQELRVGCATCHFLRPTAALPASTAELDQFHRGLTLTHGQLRCASCHVPGQVDRLALAGGATVPMSEVMSLCGQCHGPQLRDYQHGAHGGMRGHWDLSRGPRTRQNCVDCHDPHAPVYVGGQPAPGPRDRFLESRTAAARNDGTDRRITPR